MKRWSENRTFALFALLVAVGLVLAVATSDPRTPAGKLRASLTPHAAQLAGPAK
jgi:hypothetical protein